MIGFPRLFAILGAVACALSGAAMAQDRDHGRGEQRGAYDRDPGRDRGRPPMREGGRDYPPGAYGYGPSPPMPPRYAAPPPRRPAPPIPGWNADREEAPGLFPGRVVPLGRVIDAIRRRSPGRELDAAVEVVDGRSVYRVLWVTDRGRRVDFIVDAETGAILSER